jgi:hypothetical protein
MDAEVALHRDQTQQAAERAEMAEAVVLDHRQHQHQVQREQGQRER